MIVCFNYTKTSINLLSLIISLIITLLFGMVIFNSNKMSLLANIETEEITIEKVDKFEQEKTIVNLWKIEIPKIDLVADISEGTSDDVLNEFVGHFEDTMTENGNVGLAAHNRGYNVNYFSRIKELEIGDEIIYKINDNTKYYKVSLITIIDDTDWTYLENTKDNRLTLITCLENEPTKRRCIQALEKENK